MLEWDIIVGQVCPTDNPKLSSGGEVNVKGKCIGLKFCCQNIEILRIRSE